MVEVVRTAEDVDSGRLVKASLPDIGPFATEDDAFEAGEKEAAKHS